MNNSFFLEYEVIDWYDGAISGVGKERKRNIYYFFDIVAIDLTSKEKIFLLLKISLDFYLKCKAEINSEQILNINEMRKQLYSNLDSALILKANYIESETFQLKEIKINKLSPSDNFEDVYNQSGDINKKWFAYFLTSV